MSEKGDEWCRWWNNTQNGFRIFTLENVYWICVVKTSICKWTNQNTKVHLTAWFLGYKFIDVLHPILLFLDYFHMSIEWIYHLNSAIKLYFFVWKCLNHRGLLASNFSTCMYHLLYYDLYHKCFILSYVPKALYIPFQLKIPHIFV